MLTASGNGPMNAAVVRLLAASATGPSTNRGVILIATPNYKNAS